MGCERRRHRLCQGSGRLLVSSWLVVAASFLVAACSAPRAAGPAPGAEVSLADIAKQPQAFHEKAVLTRGKLLEDGQSAEGTWLRLAVPEAGPDTVTLVLPVATAGDLGDLHGKELEMLIRVEEPVVLADGRPAIRVYPMQLSAVTRFAPDAAPTVPGEMLAQAAVRGGFFRDPQLPAGRSPAPTVRFTFTDPQLPRPFWYVPGPVTIEKTGPPTAPEYRYTAMTKSEDDHVKESTCRFRVEQGTLRSVAYDEVVRDPSGKQVDEQHLDFVSGTVMDKVTGTRGPWPANIYAGPCLGLALAGYPFGEQRALNFFLWSEYEPTAAMYVVVDGTEEITTPAGTFECYRLRMNVDTDRMLQRLVFPSEQARDMARGVAEKMRQPDTLMWLTTAPPHLLVKVDGAMGPPGTSPSVMEMVDLGGAATRTSRSDSHTSAP
jgi:hypothetical protein